MFRRHDSSSRIAAPAAARGLARASRAFALALLFALLALAQSNASAQSARNPPKEKPAIQRAIDALLLEAEQSRKDQKLARNEADFAASFKDEIPDEDVLKAIVQQVHRNPFVDAYVRWQLTGFNPILPALDDRQFLKLMAAAPALLPNPCADDATVATFEKAEEATKLAQRDVDRLRENWLQLNRQRQVIETLNTPALQWRKWVENQLPGGGPRRIQWLIERIASTIAAGWDSRDAKGDLTRAAKDLGKSVGDLALSPQQTQMVCEQIQRMKGMRRRMIEDVAVLATGRVDVSFANMYVSDNDIEKWVESLGGKVSP